MESRSSCWPVPAPAVHALARSIRETPHHRVPAAERQSVCESSRQSSHRMPWPVACRRRFESARVDRSGGTVESLPPSRRAVHPGRAGPDPAEWPSWRARLRSVPLWWRHHPIHSICACLPPMCFVSSALYSECLRLIKLRAHPLLSGLAALGALTRPVPQSPVDFFCSGSPRCASSGPSWLQSRGKRPARCIFRRGPASNRRVGADARCRVDWRQILR